MKRWVICWIICGSLSTAGAGSAGTTIALQADALLVSVAVAEARALVLSAAEATWYRTDAIPWHRIDAVPMPADLQALRVMLVDLTQDGRPEALVPGIRQGRGVTAIFTQSQPDRWQLLTEVPWWVAAFAECPAVRTAPAPSPAGPCVLGQSRTLTAAGGAPIWRMAWRAGTLVPDTRVHFPRAARVLALAELGAQHWAVIETSGAPRYCQWDDRKCRASADDRHPAWTMCSATLVPGTRRIVAGETDLAPELLPVRPWQQPDGFYAVQQQPAWGAVIGRMPVWRGWQLVRRRGDALATEDVLVRASGALMDFVPRSAQSGVSVTQTGWDRPLGAGRHRSVIAVHAW